MRRILIYTGILFSDLACFFLIQPSLPAMIICICRCVSDREIARHVRAGMGFDEIQFETGMATQCGQCEGCARDVVSQCSRQAPTAQISQLTAPLPIAQ